MQPSEGSRTSGTHIMTTKYQNSIAGGVFGGVVKSRKPVTCKNVVSAVCPEGDLNPHAR